MKRFVYLALCLAMVVAMAVPAMAAEKPGNTVSMSARILLDTGYWSRDKELTNSGKSLTNFFMNVDGWSYLRADFTSADKTTGGRVEIGVGSGGGSAKIATRNVYAYYKVGNFKFLAGNTWPPFGNRAGAPWQDLAGDSDQAPSTSGLEMYGYGYSGRKPQISLTWESGPFAAELALVEPTAAKSFQTALGSTVDAYSYMPRFDLNVRYSAGGILVSPTVMVVNYQSEGAPSGYDESYTGWAAELPVLLNIGAFEFGAQIWYAMNNQGEICCIDAGPVLDASGKIKDGKQYGGYAYVGYTMGSFMPSVGAAVLKVENDAWTTGNGYKDDSQTLWGAYVSLKYMITDTFSVAPEVVYMNNGDDPQSGNENGNSWMIGAQFKFMF